MQPKDTQPVRALFGETVEQLGMLIGSELRLAQAELSEKIAEAGRGAAYIAAAGVLMIPAAVMLLVTLSLWLEQIGMSAVLSHLIAAAIGAALSLVFGAIGLSRLKPKHFKLKHTVRQLAQDLAVARDLAK